MKLLIPFIIVALGCASTVDEVIAPIAQPETDDKFHECILNLLTLWANERVAVAQASGADVNAGGADRESTDKGVQTEGAITVTQSQLAAVVSVCSVTADQMYEFRDLQLDCFKDSTCGLVINWPSIMDIHDPQRERE